MTGQSRAAWDTTSANLAALWDTFTAYSAVIDRANEMLAVPGRINAPRLSEVAGLLNGPSVTLTTAVAPLSQRELTSGGQTKQTLLTTVRQMRRSFSEIATVVTAAETVWNEVSEGIRQITIDIEKSKTQLPGLDAGELAGKLTGAENGLRELREQLNSDPLALWRSGSVDTTPLHRLKRQTAAATAQVAELVRVRRDADARLAEVAAAVAAAQQAWQDAMAARDRAASRIAMSAANPLPDVSGLASRLEGLPALKAAGRWTRLASELDVIAKLVTTATQQCKDAEHEAAGLVNHRNEMRGLLDAYRAKAAGLGAAENAELDTDYQRAKDLLWTAPCDLAAATAAVNGYQQAVLRLRRSGDRR